MYREADLPSATCELGADVLKIGEPGGAKDDVIGSDRMVDYQNLRRNKRSRTLSPQVQHRGVAKSVQHPVLRDIAIVGQRST